MRSIVNGQPEGVWCLRFDMREPRSESGRRIRPTVHLNVCCATQCCNEALRQSGSDWQPDSARCAKAEAVASCKFTGRSSHLYNGRPLGLSLRGKTSWKLICTATHPDDVDIVALVRQCWEMDAAQITLIHGHGHNRGISAGFVNTNTGFFGLCVRSVRRHDSAVKSFVIRSSLDCSRDGEWFGRGACVAGEGNAPAIWQYKSVWQGSSVGWYFYLI
jgi:hypothetical protein